MNAKNIVGPDNTKSTKELNETTDGKLNFWGLIAHNIKSFSPPRPWSAQTRTSYGSTYLNIIAPQLISKPLDELTEDDIKRAINQIKQSGFNKKGNHQYSQSRINHFIHLVDVAFNYAVSNNMCLGNPLFGSELILPDSSDDAIEVDQIGLRKSLTISEEISVTNQVLSNPMREGEYVGVAIMFALGLRNSEVCALDFGDVREIPHRPNNYCVWIYKTTAKNTNIVKASGKTKNADRIIPLTRKMSDFIKSRKEYITSQINDGTLQIEPEFGSVDDLPIVCIGNDYKSRSNANALSNTGKRVLEKAQLDQKVLGYISRAMDEMPVLEKEPTAYLFRRNFATHLHILGLEEAEIQYIIGHEIEDPTETRNYYSNTDKLWPIKLKMDNRPLVSDTYYSRRPILICDKPKYSMKRSRLIDDIAASNEQQIFFQLSADNNWKIKINASATEPQKDISICVETRNIIDEVNASLFISEGTPASGYSNVLKDYHQAYENALSKIASSTSIL